MALSLSNNQLRFLRQRAQRLIRQPTDTMTSVVDIVKDLCGIQAQDTRAATLAVRVRGAGLTATDVEQARVQERSVVRTWGPRGTLHLLATEDLGWLLSLFGPVFIARGQSRRMALGLDDQTSTRGELAIRDILASQGPLMRDELVEQLAMHGIRLEGQQRPHLIFYAAMQGILCLGPDRGAKSTYILLDDWIDRDNLVDLPMEAAYDKLARRYLAAYGPASSEDMASWSGLPMREVRAAFRRLAGSLTEVEIAGQSTWMLRSHFARLDEFTDQSPIIRLLADFDTYLLGYRSRDMIVAIQYAKRINAGGGMVHPTLLIDGRATGTWKSMQRKTRLEVVVEPFEELWPNIQLGLEAEAADIARFLGIPDAFVTILT